MKNVTEKTFETEVIDAETLVLVDFYTTWCGPCKLLTPKLEELSQEIDSVKFVKIDVESEEEIADKYDVQCVPSLIILDKGKVVDRKEGLISKPNLKKWIDDLTKE